MKFTPKAGGRVLVVVFTLAAVFSLWMRAGFPVYGIRGSYADDHLFLVLAQYIGEGHWLGPFNDLTLVKGPAYPIFIAVSGMLHLPLKLAEQICYLAASAALCRWIASRPVVEGRPAASLWLGGVLFLLLCFNPILWTASLARVIREGLYISLSLAVVAFAVFASFPSRPSRLGRAVLSGAGLGFVASVFWLTREEGLWLVPSVAVVIGVAAIGEFSRWRAARTRGTAPAAPEPLASRQLASFGAAAAVAAVVLGTVAAVNLGHYGKFELNEVKSSAFTHAYGALSRIEPREWQRYIVFPKDARDAAYAVSPAARELAPVLESNTGKHFAAVHCEEYAITPCIGFHAGWFQWILRDAVAAAGHYRSASEASRFYRRLASEIDGACDAHRLRCFPARNTLAPPFRWEYLLDTLHEARTMFALFATLGTTQIGRLPSAAVGGDLDAIADLVGPVQPGVTKAMFLHGWAATPGGYPSLSVISHKAGGRFTSSVDLQPQGDVEFRYPGLHAVEFTINTNCQRQDCDLLVAAPDRTEIRIPFSSLVKDMMPVDAVTKVFVDSVDEIQTFPFSTRLQHAQLWLAKRLAIPYRAARFLWPIALGGLILAFVLDFRRSKPIALYALALASLTAVVSRIALLSYLQITSIPSRNLLYLSPAMPFFIVFIVLGLFLGAYSIVRSAQERRASRSRQGVRPESGPAGWFVP